MRFVIAYDIEHDRTRRELADVLQGFGWRVQKSVFECEVEDQATADRLVARVQRVMAAEEAGGDVRFYRLCVDCHGKSFGLGDLEEGMGGAPWVVV